MSRVSEATAARQVLAEDFFGGWTPDDEALLRRHAYATGGAPGMITDFMGIRTDGRLHPLASSLHGTVVDQLPIPDDSLRAETIEYFALLTSLEAANSNGFSFVEIGAAYAPWSCTAAVLAMRSNRQQWRVVAIEASNYLFGLIPAHLASNGIDPSDPRLRLMHGAIAASRGSLKFPKVDRPDELGSQAVAVVDGPDYLGRVVEYEDVDAYRIADVLPDGVVDLVHIDVQGAEYDILSTEMDELTVRVKAIFIGTHSRLIEGQLIELFHRHGWTLVRERPTRFAYASHLSDPVAWTTRDGGQMWVNRRLAV